MRVAAALCVAAAAFAWLTAHGLLQLHSTGTTPPAIILHGRAEIGSNADPLGRERHLAVPRKVEVAPLRSFQRRQTHTGRR